MNHTIHENSTNEQSTFCHDTIDWTPTMAGNRLKIHQSEKQCDWNFRYWIWIKTTPTQNQWLAFVTSYTKSSSIRSHRLDTYIIRIVVSSFFYFFWFFLALVFFLLFFSLCVLFASFVCAEFVCLRSSHRQSIYEWFLFFVAKMEYIIWRRIMEWHQSYRCCFMSVLCIIFGCQPEKPCFYALILFNYKIMFYFTDATEMKILSNVSFLFISFILMFGDPLFVSDSLWKLFLLYFNIRIRWQFELTIIYVPVISYYWWLSFSCSFNGNFCQISMMVLRLKDQTNGTLDTVSITNVQHTA